MLVKTENVIAQSNTGVFSYTTILAGDTSDSMLISMWLTGKSQGTQKTYSSHVNQFFSFLCGIGIREVKLNHVKQFEQFLNNKGYRSNTIKVKLACLKSLFSFALKTGYISLNPLEVVKLNKGSDRRLKAYKSPEQIKDILNQDAHSLKGELLGKLLYKLGLRISEAINIKWSDFSCIGDGYNLHIVGKGNKERDLKLDNNFYHQLLELKGNSEYLFSGNNGKHLGRTQAYKLVKSYGLAPHELRHNHAWTVISGGGDLESLRQQLGHSSLSTTTIYAQGLKSVGTSHLIDI